MKPTMEASSAILAVLGKGLLLGTLFAVLTAGEAKGVVSDPKVAATIESARSAPVPGIDDLVRRLEPLDTPTVAALRAALLDADPFVRQTAVALLGQIGDPCPRLMCRLLKDEAEPVRAAAESALVDLGPPAVACLGEALLTTSPSSDAKLRAARALGRIGDPEGIPFLTETLQKFQRGGFRTDVACQSLSRIGQPGIRALIEMLRFSSLREDLYVALLLSAPEVVRAELLTLATDVSRPPEERAIYATEGEKLFGTRAFADNLLAIYADLDRALAPSDPARERSEMASLVSDRHDFLKLQLEAEYLLPLTLERIHSSFAALREAEYRREAQEDERRRQERQARRPDKDLAITVAPQPRGPGTVVDLRDPRDPVAEARLAERMKKAAVEAEKRWAENKKKQDDELKRMQIDNYLSGRHPWSPAW